MKRLQVAERQSEREGLSRRLLPEQQQVKMFLWTLVTLVPAIQTSQRDNKRNVFEAMGSRELTLKKTNFNISYYRQQGLHCGWKDGGLWAFNLTYWSILSDASLDSEHFNETALQGDASQLSCILRGQPYVQSRLHNVLIICSDIMYKDDIYSL